MLPNEIDWISIWRMHNGEVLPRDEARMVIVRDFDEITAIQLLTRIAAHAGKFIAFDPEDDGDGFLVCMDNQMQAARAACTAYSINEKAEAQ